MAGSLDLADLVTPLQAALNIPGEDIYGTVSPTEWITYLANGFWEAYLDGLLSDYIEVDGEILPISGSTIMSKDKQQLVLMYAAITIMRLRLLNAQTLFRSKAGPVEYEVQQSAQVMKALLDDFSERRKFILQRLSDSGIARGTYYIDTYLARQDAINSGYTDWIGSGNNNPPYGYQSRKIL